jgi:hypothetical protein
MLARSSSIAAAVVLVALSLAAAADEPPAFSGARAFGHLQAICALGPRPSGSPAMSRQRELVAAHFRRIEGPAGRAAPVVVGQAFQVRDRRTGAPVHMENLIVSWHPDRAERVLVGVHSDTRPFPDRDPVDPQEGHSVGWPDTRPVVDELWAAAARLGVRQFVAEPRHTVEDDHVPLRMLGGIPTCNVIDFDYPSWHTTADTPERCSAESLEAVGRVVLEWLRSQR